MTKRGADRRESLQPRIPFFLSFADVIVFRFIRVPLIVPGESADTGTYAASEHQPRRETALSAR